MLTGYSSCLFGVLASDEKHHVALAGIDIVILQEEDLVNTVLLKSTELDKEADRSSKRFLNNQVLLATDLRSVVSLKCPGDRTPNSYIHLPVCAAGPAVLFQ